MGIPPAEATSDIRVPLWAPLAVTDTGLRSRLWPHLWRRAVAFFHAPCTSTAVNVRQRRRGMIKVSPEGPDRVADGVSAVR